MDIFEIAQRNPIGVLAFGIAVFGLFFNIYRRRKKRK